MNDAVDALAIGFAIALIFSVPFAFFAFIRYLRYKETVALAERGLLRPSKSGNGRGGRGLLRWGIVITFVSFALIMGLWPIGFLNNPEYPLGFGPWMLFGCLPMAFGLSLLAIYVVSSNGGSDHESAQTDFTNDEHDPIPPHKQ